MGWTARNLTTQFQAQPAFLGPAAYLFAAQSTRHVIYLGADASGNSNGNIYEGYCGTDDVWHFKNLMSEASGAPPATAAPTAYSFEAEQTQHVLYQADDSHIHELYWDDGWNHNDLTQNTGAPEISGPATGWEFKFTGRQQLAYMGVDRLVHLLSRGHGDSPQWVHLPLTKTSDPPCAGAPGGYPFETGGTQYVNYRSDDMRLYEIAQDGVSGKWGSPSDMGMGLAGVPNAVSDQYRGFADEASGIRYVDFVGGDYNIYEYSSSGSSASPWNLTNLTQSAPPVPLASAGYRPTSYMFPSTQAVPLATQHCIYAGADGSIQELWRYSGQQWMPNGLHELFGDILLNSPSAFLDITANTQNVFLATQSGEIIELRWQVGETITFHPPGRLTHERRR